jgi:SPX domain protein involved in polyphosphate accumulation
MKDICSFQRIEKKFWLDEKQCQQLLPTLYEHLKADEYGKSDISNIYYDTNDCYLIRRSIERPLFKEKLRLRCYGKISDDQKVFIELKKKYDGIGYKQRLATDYRQAKRLLEGKRIDSDRPKTETEIINMVKRYGLSKKIYVGYKRIAMYDPSDPDLRVTLDSDICFGDWDESEQKALNLQSLMDDRHQILMEIKTSASIPSWLLKEMERLNIYQAPFSKIGASLAKMNDSIEYQGVSYVK